MEMDEEEEKKGTEKSNEKESSFMERRIVIVAYTKVGPNQEWRHLVSLEKYWNETQHAREMELERNAIRNGNIYTR